MEEVYDLRQHTYCAIIYIAKADLHTRVIRASNRIFNMNTSKNVVTHDACITYNKERTKALSYGDREFDLENQDLTRIDNFMDSLYGVYEKGTRTDEDQFLMQAISDFLRWLVQGVTEDTKLGIDRPDELHFVFVVPSEWPERIRLELIRPMFVKADIISEDDHPDRLLFMTDVESVCYGLRRSGTDSSLFSRGQNTVVSRFTAVETGEVAVKLYLVLTMNNIFDFEEALLFPKIMRSDSFTVTAECIKNSIRDFLKNKLDTMPHDLAMEAMVEGLFNSKLPALDAYGPHDDLETPWLGPKIKWRINKSQKEFIRALHPFEIFSSLEPSFIDNFRHLISSNSMKDYVLLFVEDRFYSSCVAESALIDWIKCIIDYNRRLLSSESSISRTDLTNPCIDVDDIFWGVSLYALEAIQNSDIYSRPRILPIEPNVISTSIFLKSKPDAIVNIDILLESTLLSYSFLNEDGLVEEILDHNYFIADQSLPSLGSFYQFSDAITLTVNEKFIPFSENYDFEDKDLIEHILNNSTAEKKISTKQRQYIKAFFKMYMVYLQQIVSSKLGFNTEIKIGYAISTEKKILHDIIGTEKDFEELVFATKLLCKNDDFSKLRVVKQGEGLLPVVQKFFGLEFGVRSYFVVSQVHQDYIQLTLNQVVTKDEQESVVFVDQTIPMTNIFESLCLYMWEDIMEDSSLLQLCDIHCKSDEEILELFSLDSRTNFMDSLKRYISNNILAENANWKNRSKTAIRLNDSCECKVCFTSQDVIEISFMPFLQDIVSIVTNSLCNRELFGEYRNIDYVFTTIRFNYNVQLQDVLVWVLNETFQDYNKVRGFNAICLVVPELPCKFLQPALMQRPLSYTAFQIGTLRQVHNENYGFVVIFNEKERTYFYRKTLSDQAVDAGENSFYGLVERGDRISDDGINNVFYLNLKRDFDKNPIYIFFGKLKTSDNGRAFLKDLDRNMTGFRAIYAKKTEFMQGSDIPILISVTFKGYSASLQFSARLVGEANQRHVSSNVGEPMILYRF